MIYDAIVSCTAHEWPRMIFCAAGCGRQASSKCQYNMAPYCGTCCDCSGHCRRYTRPGPRSGHRSKRKRGIRQLEQQMQWTLNATVRCIEEACSGTWPQEHGRSMSSRRRYLLSCCEAVITGAQPEEQILPEEWLAQVPHQLLERLAGFVSRIRDRTPDELALIEACREELDASSEEEARPADAANDDRMEAHADHDDDGLSEPLPILTWSLQHPTCTLSGGNALASSPSSGAFCASPAPLSPRPPAPCSPPSMPQQPESPADAHVVSDVMRAM